MAPRNHTGISTANDSYNHQQPEGLSVNGVFTHIYVNMCDVGMLIVGLRINACCLGRIEKSLRCI